MCVYVYVLLYLLVKRFKLIYESTFASVALLIAIFDL